MRNNVLFIFYLNRNLSVGRKSLKRQGTTLVVNKTLFYIISVIGIAMHIHLLLSNVETNTTHNMSFVVKWHQLFGDCFRFIIHARQWTKVYVELSTRGDVLHLCYYRHVGVMQDELKLEGMPIRENMKQYMEKTKTYHSTMIVILCMTLFAL